MIPIPFRYCFLALCELVERSFHDAAVSLYPDHDNAVRYGGWSVEKQTSAEYEGCAQVIPVHR